MNEKQNELKINFETSLGDANEKTVDKWELMSARRALQNLRCLLYGESMHKLIQPEMDENSRRIKGYLAQSNGKFREVFVHVQVKGITATEYFTWQANAMKLAIVGNPEEKREVTEKVVFPAHPEHYMVLSSGVIETLGSYPTNASVCKVDEMPQFVLDAADPSYWSSKYSGVKLEDGTIWAYGLTEYRDTEDGADMRLHVWWPDACPDVYFEDHARHFAVEYRNFIHMAYDDLKTKQEMKAPLSVHFETMLGDADEDRVDEWELMASRRALMNLRTLLYGDPMHELIGGQMEENDRNIRSYLEASNGEFREVYVHVTVDGIKVSDYQKWQADAMKDALGGDAQARERVVENVVFPAHPEHYMLLEAGVVETLGGLPTNAGISPVEEMPDFVEAAVDPRFDHGHCTAVRLADGTIWSYGIIETLDTENGGEQRLHVWWPAAAPQIFFDDHARHFAVEFRNFYHMAFDALNK